MNDNKSGINIGNVGGSVNINAGGDIVGGDKKTGDTSISIGFKQEEDKNEFLGKIEELKSYIREINDKTKDINTPVPSETKPPDDIVELIKNNLDNFEGIINEIKKENSEGGLLNKILPIAEKALPILFSARHLFGLP